MVIEMGFRLGEMFSDAIAIESVFLLSAILNLKATRFLYHFQLRHFLYVLKRASFNVTH